MKKFIELDADILATGTNEDKLHNLKKFPKINILKFKLDQHEKIEIFLDEIYNKLNGLDILVNNAGVTLDNLSIRLTEENWKKF